jgi:hypothetical protein
MDPFPNDACFLTISDRLFNPCVKQKPAIGQLLNLQTLPLCLLLLLVVMISRAEARLRWAMKIHVNLQIQQAYQLANLKSSLSTHDSHIMARSWRDHPHNRKTAMRAGGNSLKKSCVKKSVCELVWFFQFLSKKIMGGKNCRFSMKKTFDGIKS